MQHIITQNEPHLYFIIKPSPRFINTKEIVPDINQLLLSYFKITDSPSRHSPELNSINPSSANKYCFNFNSLKFKKSYKVFSEKRQPNSSFSSFYLAYKNNYILNNLLKA